ncbi:MAG: GNAT family protein [Phycisphaerae bacterium]|jgi:RimJ/RimL family protein N-acetyltransferase
MTGRGPQPRLETSDLLLRPHVPADAAAVVRVCSDRRVAAVTRTIPHPYAAADAEAFIARVTAGWEAGTGAVFAICERWADGVESEPIGSVGVMIDSIDVRGEIGYTVVPEHWGKGYATQAAAAFCGWCFDSLHLRKLTAHYMVHNEASARVLEKVGFRREGLLRGQAFKWGVAHDLVAAGLLRAEWRGRESTT